MPNRVRRLVMLLAVCACTQSTDFSRSDDSLIGHWRFQGNGKDSTPNRLHAHEQGVNFNAIGPEGVERTAAAFDGQTSTLEIPEEAFPPLGTSEFSVLVQVHLDEQLDDLPGEIISQYDPVTRTGFRLGIDSRPGVTSSQANWQNVHFGMDAGTEPGEWTDHGRLGEAILIFGITVYNGQLFAGTCEADVDQAGRVFRFDGREWHDCGAPDRCNSISSLAVYDGRLYVASSKYRLRGSALAESENPHRGGTIYRYDGDEQWTSCGTLPDVEAVNGLVVYRGRLYASSLYAPAGFFRYEGGTEWTSCGVPDGKRVESLAVHNGHIYATGYDEGAVYRFDGAEWEHLGRLEGATQTYGFATYRGDLYVSEWPHAKVYRYGGGTTWNDTGQLGEELETMPLAVYNGQMYGGTLPAAEVYRYDGDANWRKIARLDWTPDVKYRRVWSMAVFRGRLFAGTLPSGHVHSIEIGRNVTHDRSLEPGWHHLAAVREADRLKLYVDGSAVGASATFSSGAFNLNGRQPLRIGSGTTDSFCGRLSDLRLYRRALSAEEIRQISRSETP